MREHRPRAIGFDLASLGELQFFRNVLYRYAEGRADDRLYIFHHQNTQAAFDARCPELRDRVSHVPHRQITSRRFRNLDLYITTEQFLPGPPSVYTLTLFHGQPAKGVTFRLPGSPDPLLCNDAFFLYGPLHRQALQEHLDGRGEAMPPHLSLFDIGYSKSDDLINARFDRVGILRELGLDPGKQTVLYAPAFNEGASLREQGVEILNALCAMKQFNIIAKLPIDCFQPTSDFISTGGVDWVDVVRRLEHCHPNFRLDTRLEADPALAAADVLVTCVSSVAFEFMAIGRPVVYIDVPQFFNRTLRRWCPDGQLSLWARRVSVNAGREFGVVAPDVCSLPATITHALTCARTPVERQEELRRFLLYNPGRATDAAVDQIEHLLEKRVRSRRPGDQGLRQLQELHGETPLAERLHRTARRVIVEKPARMAQRFLNRRGYRLARAPRDFVDAKTTIAAARERGLSVCEYRESLEADPRKRGRRDRIIGELEAAGVIKDGSTICEVGSGTGQYLEKILAVSKPARYEVYEIDRGWSEFLASEYGGKTSCEVICQAADGVTLRETPSDSCDLVHAHAVFVYLPILQTLGYLNECLRVCRPGGHIVFDCFLDRTFTLSAAEGWLRGQHRFPVVIPEGLLNDFAATHGLKTTKSFSAIYGDGSVDYFVWKKA